MDYLRITEGKKMQTWKHADRQVVTLLGGHRVLVSGRQRCYAPDIEYPCLAGELKRRKRLPDRLYALVLAEASHSNGQLPVAKLHEHGMAHCDGLVLIRPGDLVDRKSGTHTGDCGRREDKRCDFEPVGCMSFI